MAWAWSWGVRVYHGGGRVRQGIRDQKFFFSQIDSPWPGHGPGGSGCTMGGRVRQWVRDQKNFFFLKWPGHSPGGSKSQNFFSLTRNHYQTPTLFLNWLTARKKFIFFEFLSQSYSLHSFPTELLLPLISTSRSPILTRKHKDFDSLFFKVKISGVLQGF